jgi:hypothetical protein
VAVADVNILQTAKAFLAAVISFWPGRKRPADSICTGGLWPVQATEVASINNSCAQLATVVPSIINSGGHHWQHLWPASTPEAARAEWLDKQ